MPLSTLGGQQKIYLQCRERGREEERERKEIAGKEARATQRAGDRVKQRGSDWQRGKETRNVRREASMQNKEDPNQRLATGAESILLVVCLFLSLVASSSVLIGSESSLRNGFLRR